jgi:branched-chain amino acid transport system substrate-binding protein
VNFVLAAPSGQIELDENRQAIADNFLQQIVEDETGDGVPEIKTLKRVTSVDASFAGAFTPETPNPDRENPRCVPGNPPPWTKQGGGG